MRVTSTVQFQVTRYTDLYLLAIDGFWLQVRCMGCGKVRELDPQPFVDRFWRRGSTSLDDLSDKFRCKDCGYRGAVLSAVAGPPKVIDAKIPVRVYDRVGIWKRMTVRIAVSYDELFAELITDALDAKEVPPVDGA